MNNHHLSARGGAPMRRRFSPQQIQELLADFDRSGLSAAAFARPRSLDYSGFCRWRKRHRPGRTRAPRLQAVPLGPLFAPSWMAEIALPNGANLRVTAQASAAWSAEVLRTLARSC